MPVEERSQIHGLSDLIHSRGFIRVFWIIVIITSLCGMMYYMQRVVRSYLAELVYMRSTEEQTDNLTIPDIIVVPFSRFHEERLMKWTNGSEDFIRYLDSLYFPEVVASYMDLSRSIPRLYATALTYEPTFKSFLKKENLTLLQFLDNIGYRHDEIVKSCYRGSEMIYNCSSKGIMAYAGYTAYIKGTFQDFTGVGSGLTMLLESSLSGRYYTGLRYNEGVQLALLHPVYGFAGEFIQFPAGFDITLTIQEDTFIRINQTKKSQVCKDYDHALVKQDCIITTGLTHAMRSVNPPCTCEPLMFLNLSTHDPRKEICFGLENMRCTWLPLGTEAARSEVVTLVQKECPMPCKYALYNPSMTLASTKNPALLSKDQHMPKLQQLSDRTVILNIRFSKLQTRQHKDYYVTSSRKFGSTLAGVISLCTGTSIVGVTHLLRVLTRRFQRYLESRSKRKG